MQRASGNRPLALCSLGKPAITRNHFAGHIVVASSKKDSMGNFFRLALKVLLK